VTEKRPIYAPKLRGVAVTLALLAAFLAAAPARAQPEHGGMRGGEPRGGEFRGGERGGEFHGGEMRQRGGPWGRGPGPGPGPRWNSQRYNGYWAGGRWFYGAPSPPLWGAPGFRPGFVPWRRGEYLPPDYQGFFVPDPWRYHLRRPPYGYNWIEVGGEFLLVSSTTGLIFDVVPAY
jgi:Ni/Co efflux regulator RcnB